ncbi:MAG: hypothetical protein AVDCRST_MAG03-2603, partial [uncultured Rubrobacteraceae bacterium]
EPSHQQARHIRRRRCPGRQYGPSLLRRGHKAVHENRGSRHRRGGWRAGRRAGARRTRDGIDESDGNAADRPGRPGFGARVGRWPSPVAVAGRTRGPEPRHRRPSARLGARRGAPPFPTRGGRCVRRHHHRRHPEHCGAPQARNRRSAPGEV